MKLETILCMFGQICATGNAPMQLETILCKFGQIYATVNALIGLDTLLCVFGQHTTGNIPMTPDTPGASPPLTIRLLLDEIRTLL